MVKLRLKRRVVALELEQVYNNDNFESPLPTDISVERAHKSYFMSSLSTNLQMSR